MQVQIMIVRVLYSIWLLSLPFGLYPLIGSLSLDNILAPVVCAFVFLRPGSINSRVLKGKAGIILTTAAFFFVYSLARMFSVADNLDYLSFTFFLILKQFLYFFIPIFFIRSLADWRLTSRLLVIVALVGVFSALIASLGLYEFPVQRFAQSRLGVEILKKAVGLFANYGDMAILGSYALLYMYLVESQWGWLRKWVATLILLAGYLGAQSRNMYFTLLTGVFSAFYFSRFSRGGAGSNTLSLITLLAISLLGVIIFSLLNVDLLADIKAIGGTHEAAATVDDRLGQYQYAWSIIKNNWLFGDGGPLIRYGIQVHNIWLGQLALGGIVGALAILGLFAAPFTRFLVLKVSGESQRIRVLGMSQLICMFLASEFYPSLSYIFLVILGILSVLPVVTACSVNKG